jgi:hypothetical protein
VEEEEATDSRRERTRTMVMVGRIESVMVGGDRLQLFYELCVLGVLSFHD